MRRICAITVTLVLLMLCMFGTVFAYAEDAKDKNILKNASFEDLDDSGLPVDWNTDAYVNDKGYSVFSVTEDENPLDGSYAAKITNFAENDARFSQTVSVEPNTLYCLSGYIKTFDVRGGRGANLSVEGIYAFSESVYDTSGEWKYIEWYGETGDEQREVTVFARLGGYSGESTGTALFDKLSLKKVDAVPGSGIASKWFTEKQENKEDDIEDNHTDGTIDAEKKSLRPWLFVISAVYLAASLMIMRYVMKRKGIKSESNKKWLVPCAFIIAFLVRLIIAYYSEGYSSDVNCFKAWGSNMVENGPAYFYQRAGFCDYPPGYMLLLGPISWLAGMFTGTSDGAIRVIYRFIPCLCDVMAAALVYVYGKRHTKTENAELSAAVILLAFNPITIIDSAAWGQADGFLALLLLIVALYAIESRWQVSIPVYVIAVLVKPQALIVGPVGLVFIIMDLIRNKQTHKRVIIGMGIAIAAACAVIIPFSLYQEPGWLFRLYRDTLSSYNCATLNTANLAYIFGGNWNNIQNTAPIMYQVVLAILCAAAAVYLFTKLKGRKYKWVELIIFILFTLTFAMFAVTGAKWDITGYAAMAAIFALVVCLIIRNKSIRILPYIGALLFLLIYVLGIKMHERYIVAVIALFLLAFTVRRDFRILVVMFVMSSTSFINMGIILDNCVSLGSEFGHLNNDTVTLANILSAVNVACAIYAAYIGIRICLEPDNGNLTNNKSFLLPCKKIKSVKSPLEYQPDSSLRWKLKDTLILISVTVVYSIISLSTLGSLKAPQTAWISTTPEENIVFDLGRNYRQFHVLYFAQVSRNDFTIETSDDGKNWNEPAWCQMRQGMCWQWKYATDSWEGEDGVRNYTNSRTTDGVLIFHGRYVRLTAKQIGLTLNEILFRTPDGTVIPAKIIARNGENSSSPNYSNPESLIDEQDTLEALPDYFGYRNGKNKNGWDNSIPQPSWYNSMYFDEIYHARTAFEHLKGTAPYEVTHPPLGKVIMSFFISIFGMTPFGWRFAGALVGIIMLAAIYLIAKQLTKKTIIAALACLLMSLDCMHLTQTQIATIDSFPVLFIILEYFFMLRFIQRDMVREKLSRLVCPLAFSGLFMGLGIASKWIGIYAGIGLAVLFIWHCVRHVRLHKKAREILYEIDSDTLSDENRKILDAFASSNGLINPVYDRIIICIAFCLIFFIVVPILVYLLSYIPYFAYNTRLKTLPEFLKAVYDAQISMFNYHSTPGLGMDHPFYSPWYEWPLIKRPMYYSTAEYMPDNGFCTSIFAFGNPAVWLAGIAGIAGTAMLWLKDKRYITDNSMIRWHWQSSTFSNGAAFVLIGFLAQFLPWVIVPRGTYIYHYFASIPFLIMAIALVFNYLLEKNRKAAKIAMFAYISITAAFFVLLFPYASGIMAPVSWLDLGKQFLRIYY